MIDQKEIRKITEKSKIEKGDYVQVKSPEYPMAPEIPETAASAGETEGPMGETGEVASPGDITPSASATTALPYDYEKYQKIEAILEEDLGDMYSSMDPNDQMKFKIKGEEVANSIVKIIYFESKIKVSKIISLIRSWLVLIPGINKYFLEQEAKIKTDRLLQLVDKSKKIK